jgi:hypothetical protein
MFGLDSAETFRSGFIAAAPADDVKNKHPQKHDRLATLSGRGKMCGSNRASGRHGNQTRLLSLMPALRVNDPGRNI